MGEKYHIPVMLEETIEHLNLAPGKIVVDATIGTGGHSRAILEKIMPSGKLIAIDRDRDSLEIAKSRLRDFGSMCEFVHGNFRDIDSILENLAVKSVDAFLFDLGISSYQLEDASRGFSFQSEGPLDMRMDRDSYISAYDLVNNLDEEELSGLLWQFGQERWHNRIARFLVQERQKHPITTTSQLSEIVARAVPYKYRHYRIHPATRTFQAVRIAVNMELESIQIALEKAVRLLKPSGRICAISFHSLEDRIIKHGLRRAKQEGLVDIITSKPLVPVYSEVRDNPKSRSAKLRVAEKA